MIINGENLCIHTITTKPWGIDQCIAEYSRAGVGGISVWRQAVENRRKREINRQANEAGLRIASYVRGGFFPSLSVQDRQKAIDENLRMIDEAYDLGAPLIVLVCGAVPGQSLSTSRDQIADGIAACLDHAQEAGIRLGIEPLHPMYSDDRSAVNTLQQATDLAIQLDHPMIGVTIDVYHTWWDMHLEEEIRRCGKHDKIFSFHICDWRTPTVDLLNDRGLMGEGCIPVTQIARWVSESGFHGFHEVEIFSNRFWSMDQGTFLNRIIESWNQLQTKE